MFHFLVGRIRKNNKIFNAIVKGIAINMMNMFPSFKFASKMLLHNPSMFSNLFAIYIYTFVFMFWLSSRFKTKLRIFWELSFCKTRPRTKLSISSFNSILRNVEGFFTKQTFKNFPFSHSIRNFLVFTQMNHLTISTTINRSRSTFVKYFKTIEAMSVLFRSHGLIISYSNI